MKIKKVSKVGNELQRTELSSVKAGGAVCCCDCDSPGCTDWISQVAAISGGSASWAAKLWPPA
jgi:hypothetical protein